MSKLTCAIIGFIFVTSLWSPLLPMNTRQEDTPDLQLEEVKEAIARAQERLLSVQHEEGYWDGESLFYTESEPDLLGTIALYVFFLCHVGISNSSRENAVNYMITSQRSDGSWGIPPASNYLAVLALELAGLSLTSPTLQKAYEYIDSHEGELKDQLFFDLFLYALAERYPWQEIDFPLLDDVSQLAAGSKPNAFRMDPALSFFILKTLYAEGGPTQEQQTQLKMVGALLRQRQLPNGSWFNFEQGTIFALLALYELDHDTNDERFVRGLQYLNSLQLENGSMAIFRLPIFDTAVALLALQASGIDKDKLQSAAQWLVDSRNPLGGWGWTPDSKLTADIDDTTLPIPVLLNYAPSVAQEVISFIFSRQNDDGGWGTFERDWNDPQDMKWIPLDSDILYFGDPSIPDGTGHALLALGSAGYTVEDKRVKEAVDYLQRMQFDNGMWFGWWGIPYIYGTSAALTGLEAVGVDMEQAYVQRAVEWLESCQSTDGGWGEDLKTRESPDYACIGNSTSSQTAWAILGLLGAHVSPDSKAVQNGISYLLSLQRDDGSWEPAHTMLATPPFPYSLKNAETSWPLWALSSYISAVTGDAEKAETQSYVTVVALVLLVVAVCLLILLIRRNRLKKQILVS